MDIYPVLFPALTNREDLAITVSIFDDDTGDALNLSGTSIANATAPSFTAAAWTVTDGAIQTNSATPITIQNFPIGNALSALALTVGLGLGILAGDPITIADTATGLNTMTGYVQSYAPATGALVVQIGNTFEFEIRRGRRHDGDGLSGGGYSAYYDVGVSDCDGPVISAQLGNGITIIDVGFLLILIPAALTQRMRHGTYTVAMTMTDSVNTRQVFLGELPVQYGGTMPGPASTSTSAAWAGEF